MTEDDFYAFAGVPLPDIVRALHRKQLGSEATEQFVSDFLKAKKEDHRANEGKLGHPAPIDCVVALARDAEARGIPIAVATSGLQDHVEDHLLHAGLSDLFNRARNNIVV